MEHTTFENELNEIRRRAVQELKEAIAAHKGEIDFTKYDKCPILYGGNVCKIRAFDDDIFIVTEYNYLTLDNLTIEDILYIIGTIPETDEVNDVSGVYPVPVTWVDRDDIEMQGFYTDGMTQKELEKLAERMCDIYNNGDFCSDLDLACKDCGLKEKED